LKVPVLLEQDASRRWWVFPALVERFAAIEGPFRLGLMTTLRAAAKLGDDVCESGIRLAVDYVEHVRQGHDVRTPEIWQSIPR
jgi:hypothetical protein